MRNLYIDPNTGDLSIQGYNLRRTETATEYYGQKIENECKLVYGEYFLDRTRGLPYYGPDGLIMSKNPDLGLIRALIIAAIVAIDGIASVESYTSDFNQALRTYTAQIEVITDSGLLIRREFRI